MKLALVLFAAVVSGFGSTASAQNPQNEWTARVAPGQRVDVRVIAGSLKAGRSEDADVHVEAMSSDPALQVQVRETATGVLVCTVIDGVGCESENNRSSRIRDVPSVDLVVRVPAGVAFSGSMVSGTVDVEGLTSDINVATVSGDATIALPAGTNAEFSATTVSGRIESELPLEVSSRDVPPPFLSRRGGGRGPQVIRATIGTGGQTVKAVTVSGDIRLRQQ